MVKRCKEIMQHEFSGEVKKFAQFLTNLRTRREDADYDPLAVFKISDVLNEIRQAEALLQGLSTVDAAEQARFAYFVALTQKARK